MFLISAILLIYIKIELNDLWYINCIYMYVSDNNGENMNIKQVKS